MLYISIYVCVHGQTGDMCTGMHSMPARDTNTPCSSRHKHTLYSGRAHA